MSSWDAVKRITAEATICHSKEKINALNETYVSICLLVLVLLLDGKQLFLNFKQVISSMGLDCQQHGC